LSSSFYTKLDELTLELQVIFSASEYPIWSPYDLVVNEALENKD